MRRHFNQTSEKPVERFEDTPGRGAWWLPRLFQQRSGSAAGKAKGSELPFVLFLFYFSLSLCPSWLYRGGWQRGLSWEVVRAAEKGVRGKCARVRQPKPEEVRYSQEI